MPALLHTSARMASRRVALTSQNFTEDDRGLVSASLQFVAKASDRSAVDAMFYTDAPPPIWPTYLDRGRLIGRNLFMQSRSLTEQYGLLTIDASFVGGRERIVPARTSDFESAVEFDYVSPPFTINSNNPTSAIPLTQTIQVTSRISYTYTPIVISLSFVQVGGIASYDPATPPAKDLFILSQFDSSAPRASLQGGVETYKLPRQYFIDTISKRGVLAERKAESLTPSVSMITARYSLR